MRPRRVLLLPAAVVAAVLLPSLALGADEGPTNPLEKQVLLYLDSSGGLVEAVATAGLVPAGPANVDGTSTPVLWSVEATRNARLDSAVYVELFVVVQKPTFIAGGPEGAALKVQLALNGEPVEGAVSLQKLPSTLLQPGEEHRLKLFLPQADVTLAPGDTVGLLVSYYGLNPEGQDAVAYKVGGETGSRLVFSIRLVSLDELDLPAEVGPWKVAPLAEFDPAAVAKEHPGAQVFTLRAFQFGFRGAPVVVPNGTKVVLNLYVDESLSGAGAEGHGGHGGHEGGAGADDGLPWDQSAVAPLHGFSLAALDGRLQTVLFDNLVVTMVFDATKPGNYTFLCTVFCGSGHGGMIDRLTIQAADASSGSEETQQLGPGAKPTPGPPAALALGALALLALLARRR